MPPTLFCDEGALGALVAAPVELPEPETESVVVLDAAGALVVVEVSPVEPVVVIVFVTVIVLVGASESSSERWW